MMVLPPRAAIRLGEYQFVSRLASQLILEKFNALSVEWYMTWAARLGFGDVDVSCSQIHVVCPHGNDLAVPRTSQQGGLNQLPQVGRTGVDEPDSLGIRQETNAGLVGFGKRLDLPPFMVSLHQTVVIGPVQDRLQDVQNPVSAGFPGAPFVSCQRRGAVVLALGKAAGTHAGGPGSDLVQPCPYFRRPYLIDEVVPKGRE